MDNLVVGTIETYSVELDDRLDNITDLTSYVCQFKITDEDEDTIVQDWTSSGVSTDGMRMDCLLDTTAWGEGVFKLYVRVNISPEVPILGPFELNVS